jgi:DHA2 family lincomycin resistance protein-like MFS transporter
MSVPSSDTATPATTGHGAAHPEPKVDPASMRVIWLMLIAAFVAILNETTMGIAIPHLNRDLGLPPELGQWLTSAFMLTMAVVIPITGYLLERFTTRQVFITAMGVFSLGTLLCLVAQGFGFLLVGRVVQACGTGVMMPLLMTTMMNVVPHQIRGRMMGRIGLVMSLAPAIGPTLAGAVLDAFNWRALFAIVLPIALIALVIGAKLMTNVGETERIPLDVLSVVLSALAFGGIVFGLSQFGGGQAGPGGLSAGALGGIVLGGGLVFLAVFVLRQLSLQKADDALLDLRVFRSKNFTLAVIIMTIVALSMFGTLTLLPQVLQNVIGIDALLTGLILLPGSVLMGILGPFMGRVYDARGPKTLLVPGSIMVSVCLFAYATLTQNTPWELIMVIQTVLSVGLAMSFTPLFSASLGSLRKKLYSHGSAVLNTLQQVAGAAGVAVLTVTYSGILHAGQADGLDVPTAGAPGARTAFLIAACISITSVVLSFFLRKPVEDDEEE